MVRVAAGFELLLLLETIAMPRIPTPTILKAYHENPLLALLLQECRTLESARNELRWLREFLCGSARERRTPRNDCKRKNSGSSRLRELCRERSRGIPLQYILGSQPFGEVDILCNRGVLIPRFVGIFL